MYQRKKHEKVCSTDNTINEENIQNLENRNSSKLFYIALLVRISSVFITRTFFVPDEYWQSSEVAHRKAFGYGYLTWEWKEQIRSYFYPFIFEIYFRLLRLLSLDTVLLVRYGPHVLQAILTAVYDISVYRLTYKLTACRETALIAFYLNISSWFIFYTGSRTLSNVAEMCFSTIGLSYFPAVMNDDNKHGSFKELIMAFFFGGLACITRPTCFLIWIPLVLHAILWKTVDILTLIKACLVAVPILLIFLFGIDFYFYGSFTVVHYNFLNFNIFQNIGEFYGAHAWHWYFLQGLPVVLNFHLVFVFLGASLKSSHLWISLFYIFIHRYVFATSYFQIQDILNDNLFKFL